MPCFFFDKKRKKKKKREIMLYTILLSHFPDIASAIASAKWYKSVREREKFQRLIGNTISVK
jgi:hypothetical protein